MTVNVDDIIEEEGLTNDPVEPDEDKKDDDDEAEEPAEKKDDDSKSDDGDQPKPGDVITPDEKDSKEDEEEKPEDKKDDDSDDKTASEIIEESKTLIGSLQLTEDKIYDGNGNARPFEDLVPVGAYLASQLEPIVVTDKDGKQHEFMLISDVEKKFPDGFEAKNNIEQLKFERSIMKNETKFEDAVANYNSAKDTYQQEVGALSSSREHNQNLGLEYVAMAKEGIVPEVKGDVNDPNNEATKALNEILEFMDKTNADLAKKGMGEITSLWVAKQLMDKTDEKSSSKDDKKEEIIKQRKSVASLGINPVAANSEGEKKKIGHSNVPMSTYIEELIAQENLK